jgi:hypothetical protein
MATEEMGHREWIWVTGTVAKKVAGSEKLLIQCM